MGAEHGKPAALRPIPADRPDVLAFRIGGDAGRQDMAALAEQVEAAMDRHDRIDLLLELHDFGAGAAWAGLSPASLHAQARAARHVRRYAVVGAPAAARWMIDAFDSISAIEARTFDPDETGAAWAFVGARPAG